MKTYRLLGALVIASLLACSSQSFAAGSDAPSVVTVKPSPTLAAFPPFDIPDIGDWEDPDEDPDGGFGDGPELMFAQPTDGQTGVATSTPLMLIFGSPMAQSQAVAWSSNVDPSKISYSWMQGMMLTITHAGGWPGNATITYTLNPPGAAPGFKDLSGTPLPTTQGSFSTGTGGGGSGDPCDDDPQGRNSAGFFLAKFTQYVQTNDSQPSLVTGEDELAVVFQAIVNSPTNNPVTEARVTAPGNRTLVLSNFFGGTTFMYFQEFATPAEMDAAYPAGNYTLTVRRSNGASQTGTLIVPANVTVPTPRLANYSQVANFVAAQDFTFRWDPFTGAVVNRDFLSFAVNDKQGHEFHAPDACVPRELPVTATSIVVPRNTLAANTGNSGSISFSRMAVQNQNFMQDIPGSMGVSKMTQFNFAQGAAPPTEKPEMLSIARTATGSVVLRIKVTVGATYQVLYSVDLRNWLPVQTSMATASPVEFTHTPPAGAPAGYYQAAILP
jgi:hypothetical protein